MVELGALPRAKENLAKLQKLCAKPAARRWRCCRRRSRAGPALAAAKPPPTPEEQLSSAARASATNSSTLTRFGAAFRIDSELVQRIERARHALEARSQHLAPLAERRRGQPLQHRRIDARGLVRRGRYARPPRRPWAAARRPSGGPPSRCAASSATGRRPTGGRNARCPGVATIRSATSRWNIRVSDDHHGGQGPPSQRSSSAVPTL